MIGLGLEIIGGAALTVIGDYAFKNPSFQSFLHLSSIERRHGLKKGP